MTGNNLQFPDEQVFDTSRDLKASRKINKMIYHKPILKTKGLKCTVRLSVQSNVQQFIEENTKVIKDINWHLTKQISFVLLCPVFNDLNTVIEALELLHSLLLDLDWSNGWWCFNFRFEPPVRSRRIWRWALTRRNRESRCSHLRTVRETLLFSLLWDKKITIQIKQFGNTKPTKNFKKTLYPGSKNKSVMHSRLS